MRVGIIAANNIRFSPYISFYTDILNKNRIAYELIYPERNGLEEVFEGIAHTIPWNRKLPVFLNYALYANAVVKVVQQYQYDALIVLTSVNAAYLALWLKKNYSGRYIVDIRDYSHENIPPYFFLESVAVRNSGMNVISSAKFTEFLPRADYSVCHNVNQDEAVHSKYSFHKGGSPIRIGYVGALSYVEQCKRLMNLVAADERFTLDFYGSSLHEPTLKAYAQELCCKRIRFYGAYSPNEKSAIIQNVDILFNAYGNGIPLLDCALSNKLYDAFIHKKPILTCPNTYMTEMGGLLAFPIDLATAKTLEELYEWYMQLEGQRLEEFANSKLESILRENRMTEEKVVKSLPSL